MTGPDIKRHTEEGDPGVTEGSGLCFALFGFRFALGLRLDLANKIHEHIKPPNQCDLGRSGRLQVPWRSFARLAALGFDRRKATIDGGDCLNQSRNLVFDHGESINANT
jgi:hypothetical protein